MKKILLILFFTIQSGMAWAIDPPRIVYRCDSRSPEEIKAAGGFYPNDSVGKRDYDLAHHFTGESVEGHTSGFVSTTHDFRTVANYCIDIFYEHGSAWVYEIVPGENFYSVTDALIAARDRHAANGAEAMSNRIERLRRNYGTMEEYVAIEGIGFDRVRRHARLTRQMVANAESIMEESGSESSEEPENPLYNINNWKTWTVSHDYNPVHNNESASNTIYSHVGYPSSSVLIAQNSTGSEMPLRFSCQSMPGGSGSSRQQRDTSFHKLEDNGQCSRIVVIKRPYATNLISSIIE